MFKTQTEARPGGLGWYWVLVALFLLLSTLLFYARPSFLNSLRLLAFDGYQRVSPAPQLSDSPVRTVDIDEASLAHLGQWPWPRSTMADLTHKLGDAGASAIVFDIMFTEPDRTSPEQMVNFAPAQGRAALQRVVADWPSHDRVFADALSHYPTVLAATLQNERTTPEFPAKNGFVVAGDDPAPFLPPFTGVSADLPILTDAAPGVGFINWLPDRDQVVRRVPLFARQGDTIAPSLVLEALRLSEGASTYIVRASNSQGANAFGRNTGVSEVKIGTHEIPTDSNSNIWLHFRHSDVQHYVPAWRVLSGEADPAQFRGKIVLIGTSAPGLLDLRATPLDSAVPGVEIHQQALEQILHGRLLSRPDFAPGLEWLSAILSVLALAFVAPRVSPLIGAGLGVGIVIAICAAGLLLFVSRGFLFDPVYPAANAFVFAAGSATYLYRRAEVQRAEIRRAFSQYVAPDVVHQLTAHPERLKLGGEIRTLTVLMCDIRNFTSIAEGLSAEQLTAFINSFLTPLTDIIVESGGTIDKYIGDAIMAFWNAPLDDPEHARHACSAALSMMQKMRELNVGWRAQAEAAGRPFKDVAIGIGLNSGEACVGNLGSDRHFDYSAIGDTVNVASRLEGMTKMHGVGLLAGEETVARAPELPFFEIDLVRLKGRKTPSRVFTLAPDANAWSAHSEQHQAFLAAYRAGSWNEAEQRLSALKVGAPEGLRGAYATYERRLARLSANPPEVWEGVYELEEK